MNNELVGYGFFALFVLTLIAYFHWRNYVVFWKKTFVGTLRYTGLAVVFIGLFDAILLLVTGVFYPATESSLGAICVFVVILSIFLPIPIADLFFAEKEFGGLDAYIRAREKREREIKEDEHRRSQAVWGGR